MKRDVRPTRRHRLVTALRELDASWWTIGLFATVLAFGNGFLLASVQHTVGAIERLAPPFDRFLVDSLGLLPVYVVAIVAALLLSRRLVGEERRPAARLWSAVGAVILAAVAVGIVATVISSVYDFVLQVRHLNASSHVRHAQYRLDGTTPVLIGDASCDATCKMIALTRDSHFRAFWFSLRTLLLMDTVIVLWVLAMRGGVVWRHKLVRARRTDTAAGPALAAG